MASSVEVVRPLRRTEYDALVANGAFQDERIELLDGALVPTSPIVPPHSSAVQKLMELLLPALFGRAVEPQSASKAPSRRTSSPNRNPMSRSYLSI